jgi:hypothetical protein
MSPTAEVLRNVLQSMEVPSRPTVDSLLLALAKLHIIPFTPESVALYKECKLMEVAQNTPPDLNKYRPAGMRLEPSRCHGIRASSEYCEAFWDNPYGSMDKGTRIIIKRFRWVMTALAEFSPVPPVVRSMVQSISQKEPDATFGVDALRDEGEQVCDPFLCVRTPYRFEPVYYIHVWDEAYRP